MTDTGNTVTENTYTGNTDTCNDRIAVARMINLASYKGYLDTDYENVAKDYNLSRELEAKKNNLIHESKNAENIFYETVEELIKAKNELSEAIEELESILAELESDDVDVDELAEHVQRASQLIELCRERIGKAKLRIEEVVSQLEAD